MNTLMIALGTMEFGSRVEKQTAFGLLDQYVDAEHLAALSTPPWSSRSWIVSRASKKA